MALRHTDALFGWCLARHVVHHHQLAAAERQVTARGREGDVDDVIVRREPERADDARPATIVNGDPAVIVDRHALGLAAHRQAHDRLARHDLGLASLSEAAHHDDPLTPTVVRGRDAGVVGSENHAMARAPSTTRASADDRDQGSVRASVCILSRRWSFSSGTPSISPNA